MQQSISLDWKLENFSPTSLEGPSYQTNLDVILKTNREGNWFNRFKDKIKNKYYEFKEKVGEYKPIIVGAAIAASPLPVKLLDSAGLYIANSHKGIGGNIIRYALIGVGVALTVGGLIFGFHNIHSLSPNHEQYVGSSGGYEEFVPHNTINYNGNTDPTGDLILPNGTTIHNTIWNGQYASTIIQNHNQIDQLNNQFVGQTDPVNNQPYVPLQDFYVIKGQVPIQQVTINGQPYTVIEANNINPANIAGFYTYDKWISNFVAAMNTPRAIPERLPGNSPVFHWQNPIGTVAYQTGLYEGHGVGGGSGEVLIEPNETIISYGVIPSPFGSALFNFTTPQYIYPSS